MKEEKKIWAITTYYNPLHYQSRINNYKLFRKHLALQLCTVEHSLDGSYELEEDDAEILIQISSKDVIWQKERLLNVALTKLPTDTQIIVWLDCDVIFNNKYWYSILHTSLQKSIVVQCYSEVIDLKNAAKIEKLIETDIFERGISVASIINSNMNQLNSDYLTGDNAMRRASPGGAWAANKNFIQKYGFYDAMILGGGDRLYAYACIGKIEEAINIARLDNIRADHYRQWATPVFNTIKGKIGIVEGQLLHLWHGDIANRHYLLRHQLLDKIKFNPERDIEIDESGAWKWTTQASKKLQQFVASYFVARDEDGQKGVHSLIFQTIQDI